MGAGLRPTVRAQLPVVGGTGLAGKQKAGRANMARGLQMQAVGHAGGNKNAIIMLGSVYFGTKIAGLHKRSAPWHGLCPCNKRPVLALPLLILC
jgi:hypothetical protein